MGNVTQETYRFFGKTGEIYAQTEEAIAILQKMEAKAADLRSQKTELTKLATATKACWAGKSGDEMRQALAAMAKEQEAIAKTLEDNAAAMRQEMQKLEDADQALARSILGVGTSGGAHGGSGTADKDPLNVFWQRLEGGSGGRRG